MCSRGCVNSAVQARLGALTRLLLGLLKRLFRILAGVLGADRHAGAGLRDAVVVLPGDFAALRA
eukprot:7274257-Prorocentrum_lima.AAC.1